MPIRVLLTLLVTLLVTGCQRSALLWANRGLAPPDASVVYAPSAGLSLDVYKPTATSGERRPVVVFFYGGGWSSGRREDYRFIGRKLAEAGLVAVVADYRLWPTVGFPVFVEDGAGAIAWAHAHAAEFGGDPERLFVAGHSAGAQIAALVGTDPRYLRAHGMQPRNLAGVIGLAGPYDFDITGDLIPIFGPVAQWPHAQALRYADGNAPPFLLVHGDADKRVEARDSVLMAERLRANNVEARLLILEDAGHTAPLRALYAPARDPRVLDAIRQFTGAAPD